MTLDQYQRMSPMQLAVEAEQIGDKDLLALALARKVVLLLDRIAELESRPLLGDRHDQR